MTPLPLFALAGCLAVNAGADRIVAADLAPALPQFAAAAPDATVGFAPVPGVERVFHVPELRRLAARFALSVEPQSDVCFMRRVALLAPERLVEAMRRTLPAARIEVLETSRQPAPEGEIEFPLAGLHGKQPGSAAATLWTGWVRYAANRRFAIWARVQVSEKAPRILAAADLQPGKPIAESDLQAVEREELPGGEGFAASIDEVIGKLPRAPIRAGSAIRVHQLDTAKDVVRGDTVALQVSNGGASLRLEAIAEASGSIGDTILVRNPATQKCFRARVKARGVVSIDAAARKVTP